VSGRAWVLPTDRFTSGNIAVGVGLKVPTGNSSAKDTFPNISGTNPQLKPVDQSVQPGDGGWGLTMDISGFKRTWYATLFGSASYLANPRDRNGTTAIGYNITAAAVPPINADGTSYNSVPDQFIARLGGAVPIGRTGLACSLAWRVEGLPRYDLFGKSHGFRRPGVEMFVEPGVSYAKGSHVYSVQIPLGYYRNRFPNPYTGNKGDATFPKYIVLASYGYRFGGSSKPNASLTATRSPAPHAVAVGGRLEPFKLKTLDGAQKTLQNVLGKATLVVFFYPTCPFCNVAAPEIQRLYDAYKAQGLRQRRREIAKGPDRLCKFGAFPELEKGGVCARCVRSLSHRRCGDDGRAESQEDEEATANAHEWSPSASGTGDLSNTGCE
jgi:hypothetical protein